jgi:tRNA U38,U39,U40 pseudouridine synthase TruA
VDSESLLQSVGAAVVGGVGSLFAALHSAQKKYKELKLDVEDLTEKVTKIQNDSVLNSVIAEWKDRVAADLSQRLFVLVLEVKEEFNTRFDGLRRGFRFELDSHKEDMERKLREFEREFERQPTKQEIVTEDDLRRLETRIDRLRDDQSSFVKASTFSTFAEEQTRQWTEMNRKLGEMMGALRRPPNR